MSVRDRAALAIAALVAGFGLIAFLFGSYDSGIRWQFDSGSGHLIVVDIEPLSQAQRDGIVAGMIAVEVNGWTLIDLPHYEYAEPNPDDPEQPPVVVGIAPTSPQNAADLGDQFVISRNSIENVGLIT